MLNFAIVVSNVGIVLVSLALIAVDWHSDNALVKIVRTLNPFNSTTTPKEGDDK